MTSKIPLGPFELYHRIGKGGMGEVWEGMHVPEQVPVAVKVLTHTGARRASYAEAFRTEVRASAALNHPGIVTLLDYGEFPTGAAELSGGMFVAGTPYIVMELARRGSLNRFQHGLSWRDLKAVLLTVLDALAHAHACGVVHRDLKPANILVGCGGEDEFGVRITDFGLAHALDQHEVGRPQDMGWGTPQFMAPEQFRGAWRDYGPWTDLYALGIMTFHLVTGEYPYSSPSTEGLARAHSLGSPGAFTPRFAVPNGLEHWVHRLIQKRPEERYQCAADAAWALQKLQDPPVSRRKRGTVSMLPLQEPPSHHEESTADGARERRNTSRGMTGLAVDDAPTFMDRPDTTQLVVDTEGQRPLDTAVFARSSMGKNAFPAPAQEPGAALSAYREAPPMPYTWRTAKQRPPSLKLVGAGLGLFGLRTLPMVNRDAERDMLWKTLCEVREKGRARGVLIRGPAGTGKSWLARWLCRRGQEVGGAVVLKAMFSPIAGPGDGLARMISQHLRAGGMGYEETVERVRHVVGRLGVRDDVEIQAMADFLMPIGSRRPTSDSMSIRAQGQAVRYGLLYRHLQRLAEDRPVVVWFDDVQWGADALAFVQFVIERQHQNPAPVLFLMTARNESLVTRAVETSLVAQLARNRRLRVLDVEPLDADHTRELVGELLSLNETLAEEVGRRCGGNPLFAVQLVGDWVAGNRLRFGRAGFELSPGADPDIPDDLHMIWKERLSLVLRSRPADDIVALEIAAALGNSVELDEWYAACAQYGASSPVELTGELLASGLGQSSEFGFDFCHGLLRESLERGARESDRWVDINAACLRMLEARYPNQQFPFSERYARHVQEADALHLAVEPLLEAARARLDRSEFPVARSLLEEREQLLDALENESSSAERVDGWTTHAQIALWEGRFEEAESLASRAGVEARRRGWIASLGRANLVEGLGALYRGDLRRAETLLSRAVDAMRRAGDSVGEGECLLALGRAAESRAEFDRAAEHFERAREIMLKAEHRLGEAQCLNALGDIARDRSMYLEARRHCEDARLIFEELHNAIGVADCTNDLAELCRLEGDLEGAAARCSTALQMYESLGSEHSMHVRTNLALTLAAQGHDLQALQLLEEVRMRFFETGQSGPFGAATLLLLPILGRLGRFEALEQYFAEAASAIERTGVKGRDVLVAALQTMQLLDDNGLGRLAERIRTFAGRTLT